MSITLTLTKKKKENSYFQFVNPLEDEHTIGSNTPKCKSSKITMTRIVGKSSKETFIINLIMFTIVKVIKIFFKK